MDYKHYIKIDSGNNITQAFSSWQTELKDGTEIEICESNDRHFQLNLINEDGEYNYKYQNNSVVEA